MNERLGWVARSCGHVSESRTCWPYSGRTIPVCCPLANIGREYGTHRYIRPLYPHLFFILSETITACPEAGLSSIGIVHECLHPITPGFRSRSCRRYATTRKRGDSAIMRCEWAGRMMSDAGVRLWVRSVSLNRRRNRHSPREFSKKHERMVWRWVSANHYVFS